MRHLSLFSGICGIDLAAHWAGMETVAFCEREPFPQKIIRKHWPGVPIYDDVCKLTKEVLEQDEIIGPGRAIDLVSAGFPCQPFSHAGKREGSDDERYLWPDVVRVLTELQPPWFVGENVAGLLSMAEPNGEPRVVSRSVTRWPEEDFYEAVFSQQEVMLIGRICQDLENIGYEVQVYVLPAAAVGASHGRERVFITGLLGNAKRIGCSGESRRRAREKPANGHSRMESGVMGYTTSKGLQECLRSRMRKDREKAGARMELEFERSGEAMADPGSSGRQERHSTAEPSGKGHSSGSSHESRRGRAAQPGMGGSLDELSSRLDRSINPLDVLEEFIAAYPQPALLGQAQHEWEPPRVAAKVPNRVPRLKALGNAVDPLQIYPILYAIKIIQNQLNLRNG